MRSTRGFDGLEPTKQGLQNVVDREEALKIVYPAHPTRPGDMRVRVGIDKSGRYRLFERHAESSDIKSWMPGLELSTTQYRKLRALHEAHHVRTDNGPYGCFLFYHVHENMTSQ